MIAASSWVETYPVPYPLEVSARRLAGLRQRFFESLAPCHRVPLDRDWHDSIGASRPTHRHLKRARGPRVVVYRGSCMGMRFEVWPV
jgi:hypothetical protein